MQDASIAGEVILRMFGAAIPGAMKDCRRRTRAAKGAVIARIDPDPSRGGLALRENRDCRVVAVHALAGEDVRADAVIEGPKEHRAAADLVGQRRDAEINALTGIALRLAVQWLMLPVLLKQHHREQARADKASRQHVEGGRGLRDPLAGATGELLPNVLQHLPVPRHHLECLCHVLAELGESGRTTARAGGRAGNDDPLARQVLGQGLADGLPAREGTHARRVTARCLSEKLILGGRGLPILQFELHLLEETGAALAALAIKRAAHLLDREPQMRDHRFSAGLPGAQSNEIGLSPSEVRLARDDQTLERLDVVRQSRGNHARRRADSSPSVGTMNPN